MEGGDIAPLFERVVDAMRERFALIDQKENIIFLNNAALPRGKKKEDVIGKQLFAVYPNLIEQGFVDLVKNVFSSGEEYGKEFIEHRTLEGYVGYHHRKIIPFVQGGFVKYAAIIIENVHETKVARAEAERAQMQFKDLIEKLQLFSFELDTTGKFLYVNGAVGPLFGYSPAEMIGQQFARYTLDEDGGRLWQVFWQIVNQGISNGVCENKFQGADGRVVYLRCNIHPVYDEDGKIVGCRGVGEDITVDAERVSALEDAHSLFQQAFQVCPLPLLVVREGKVEVLNKAAYRVCNSVSERVKGAWFLDLFFEEDRAAITTSLSAAERSGRGLCRARLVKNGKAQTPYLVSFMRVNHGLIVALDAKNP